MRTILRAALAALCLTWAGAAPAAPAQLLAEPWPAAGASAVEGTRITFPSHSPFGLSDVGGGPAADPATEAQGVLFTPSGASAAEPVPAVVLLHGSGGMSGARELTYGRQFAAMGVAALAVDAFGARRYMASGFIDRLLNITESMLLADAFSALRLLDGLPEVDGRRVALMGFSYGGMAATYAAYEMVAARYAPEGLRFAAHIAFYGPCIAEFADDEATGAPVLMLWGGEDAIIDPERCAGVAEELREGGAKVEMVEFPGAYHQWDGGIGSPRMIGRSLASCRFLVEADGTVRDRTTFLPVVDGFTRKIALGLCSDSQGYMIGRDDAVRAQSNREVGRFLARALSVPPA